jgi:hypothetical protein
MNPIGKDKCPKCGKERTLYDNESAHCFNCNSDFDIGMKKFKR